MKVPPSSGFLVLALLLAVGVGVFVVARRGMTAEADIVREIDRSLMAEYARLVGAEQYGEAWEKCLTKSYREEVPRERFVAAHEKRRSEAGPLGGAKLLRHSTHRNLFSKTRTHHLLYELSYPAGTQPQVAIVNDADGTFRIEGTYHEGAGETLDFLLW